MPKFEFEMKLVELDGTHQYLTKLENAVIHLNGLESAGLTTEESEGAVIGGNNQVLDLYIVPLLWQNKYNRVKLAFCNGRRLFWIKDDGTAVQLNSILFPTQDDDNWQDLYGLAVDNKFIFIWKYQGKTRWGEVYIDDDGLHLVNPAFTKSYVSQFLSIGIEYLGYFTINENGYYTTGEYYYWFSPAVLVVVARGSYYSEVLNVSEIRTGEITIWDDEQQRYETIHLHYNLIYTLNENYDKRLKTIEVWIAKNRDEINNAKKVLEVSAEVGYHEHLINPNYTTSDERQKHLLNLNAFDFEPSLTFLAQRDMTTEIQPDDVNHFTIYGGRIFAVGNVLYFSTISEGKSDYEVIPKTNFVVLPINASYVAKHRGYLLLLGDGIATLDVSGTIGTWHWVNVSKDIKVLSRPQESVNGVIFVANDGIVIYSGALKNITRFVVDKTFEELKNSNPVIFSDLSEIKVVWGNKALVYNLLNEQFSKFDLPSFRFVKNLVDNAILVYSTQIHEERIDDNTIYLTDLRIYKIIKGTGTAKIRSSEISFAGYYLAPILIEIKGNCSGTIYITQNNQTNSYAFSTIAGSGLLRMPYPISLSNSIILEVDFIGFLQNITLNYDLVKMI
jgi:hypothetical protein